MRAMVAAAAWTQRHPAEPAPPAPDGVNALLRARQLDTRGRASADISVVALGTDAEGERRASYQQGGGGDYFSL